MMGCGLGHNQVDQNVGRKLYFKQVQRHVTSRQVSHSRSWGLPTNTVPLPAFAELVWKYIRSLQVPPPHEYLYQRRMHYCKERRNYRSTREKRIPNATEIQHLLGSTGFQAAVACGIASRSSPIGQCNKFVRTRWVEGRTECGLYCMMLHRFMFMCR